MADIVERLRSWADSIDLVFDGSFSENGHTLRDAIAEIERLRASAGWRTIETAPKDGTWILGWSVDGQLFRVSWGRNHRNKLGWCTSFASFVDGVITHWLPLPAPPEGEGNG